MRVSTVTAFLACATFGLGCPGGPINPGTDGGTLNGDGGLYANLGPSTAVVSGAVYDPEAFFYSLALFQADPSQGPPPPPALFAGTPYLVQSIIPGAQVSIVNGTTVVAKSSVVPPTGEWQVSGVPEDGTSTYEMDVTPPAGPVQPGAGLPNPPFTPIPAATYFPTRTLRPLIPARTYCLNQIGTIVGSHGALEALSLFLSAPGKPVTVADLLNPTKTGGVLLVWVYSPSFFLEFFTIPSGGVTVTTNRGTLYPLEWAPPGVGPPGQSQLGYFVSDTPPSSLGYYALVLPKGTSPSVTLKFTDTVTDPPNGRPWTIPSFQANVTPGVSFRRHFPVLANPPPDPNTTPQPSYDYGWSCDGVNGTY